MTKVEAFVHNLNCSLMTDRQALFSAERLLLIAVLERSVRDLSLFNSRDIVKASIIWFKGSQPSGDKGFTFKQCADELELSTWQLKYLSNLVAQAESTYDKCETKGEKSGAGDCSLASIEGASQCQEDAAVQRRSSRRCLRYSRRLPA